MVASSSVWKYSTLGGEACLESELHCEISQVQLVGNEQLVEL